ncbi:MAG: FAD-dependent oxidoreductase [Planctomycetes bacterium]|nr:FAD-dependent oxidoreductase [Planctomycetota bacterium]
MSAGERCDALVVGTGVSGLACALRLAEAGFSVAAWERRDVAQEVSSVAAAVWYPYEVAGGAPVERWAFETLRELERLAADPATGVALRRGVEWFPPGVEPPAFLRALPEHAEVAPASLHPARARGVRLRLPVADTGRFLPWLRARCAALGVRFARREVASLGEALEHAPLVVNCTGLAARELCRDRSLFPIRGQVLLVDGALTQEFTFDDHDGGPCYAIPRGRDVVLGGSAGPGREDLEPDPAETGAILARARRFFPALGAADVRAVKVGLRPGRPAVRLEAEVPRPGRVLIHDYGHGGAGVTLAFGCASEVLRLARQALPGVESRGGGPP